jgi:formylglycine-generating enzyme required for sulfatase activity
MIQLGCHVDVQSLNTITNSVGMELVLIPKGTFMMGSPESEEIRWKDEPQHQVTISKDYDYLCVPEVTQYQYEKVMGTDPSRFNGRKYNDCNYPATQVVIEDLLEFGYGL